MIDPRSFACIRYLICLARKLRPDCDEFSGIPLYELIGKENPNGL